MAAFIGGACGNGTGATTARQSVESHLMAFTADAAGLEHRSVAMDDVRRRVETA